MPMTIQQPHRSTPRHRRVTLAGWVQNALTQERLAGALITIRQAPDAFIQPLLTKVRIFGLPERWVRWRSPPRLPVSVPPNRQDIQAKLFDPTISSTARLNHLQAMIGASDISNSDKFSAFQSLLDTVSMQDWNAQKTNYGRTQTRADGSFYFTDLPAGFYQLEASLPMAGSRYGQIILDVEIKETPSSLDSSETSVFSDILKLKFELPPTTLLGKVIDAVNQEPIKMAKVHCSENKSQTLTSGHLQQNQQQAWNYRLVGLELASPTLTLNFSASGYTQQQQHVVLKPGEIKQCDVQLVVQS